MAFNKAAAWFLTEKGKKFSYFVAGGISTLTMIGNFLPHTIFLDEYKSIIHLYRKGLSVPVSEKLKTRFQKVLNLLEVDEEFRHLYKPFHVVGFDIYSVGTYYSKYGISVGLPANFEYDKESDIEKSRILINNEHVVFDSDAGRQYCESLILSEKAQMYAMAREIRIRETPKLIVDTFLSTSCVLATYGLSRYFNMNQNLYAKPLGVRVILYGLVGAFTIGNYLFLKDFSQVYYEQNIDKELKNKSQIFAEGGAEFYTKTLKRNIAFRTLLGKDGESAYTPLGNENYLLRTKHIPLVQRRDFFVNSNMNDEALNLL